MERVEPSGETVMRSSIDREPLRLPVAVSVHGSGSV
jgi:hypothetical protein